MAHRVNAVADSRSAARSASLAMMSSTFMFQPRLLSHRGFGSRVTRHRDRANARPVNRRDSGTRSRLVVCASTFAARAHDAQGAHVLVASEHVVLGEPEAFRAKTIEPGQQCAATTEFSGRRYRRRVAGLRDEFSCRGEQSGEVIDGADQPAPPPRRRRIVSATLAQPLGLCPSPVAASSASSPVTHTNVACVSSAVDTAVRVALERLGGSQVRRCYSGPGRALDRHARAARHPWTRPW